MTPLVPIQDSQEEFKALMSLLKNILRERKISYAELAKQLGMSESGLKKVFTSNDISFSRVSQIAGALGLRVTDLLNEIENNETHSVAFSSEEQKYFSENKETFYFFVRLLIERNSVEEIQEEFQLTPAETFKILKKLDSFGWIQLLPENKIKLPPLSLVRDFGSGPFLEHIYQEWSADSVRCIARPENQKSGKFIIRCLRMKPSTYQSFLQRLKELEIDLLRTAIREMKVSNKNLQTMQWVSVTDLKSFITPKAVSEVGKSRIKSLPE
ncbi:helix-turn-helix domain-containing protein [Bdellovibrio bacteriovorus]|uniref:helix-turn-helix domain-containing protein n=1 Tax=Bdellovibrio bacteriovorus TaxID=959 RepID=UPI0035A6F984